MKRIFCRIVLFFCLFGTLQAQEIHFIADFGKDTDPENFEFAAIRDVAVYENEIFVLDPILSKIHHLEFFENKIRRIGEHDIEEGRGPGEFLDPVALTVSGNYLILADARSQKIVIFDEDGNFVNEFATRFRPTKIFFSESEEKLLISGFWPTFRDELIHVFDIEGNETDRYVERPENWLEVAQTGNFERLAEQGSFLYVGYPSPYKIERYNWNGEVLNSYTDQELSNEVEEKNDIKTIPARIIDMEPFDGHLITLVQIQDDYRIDLFDASLNKLESVPGESFQLDHMSFLRVIDNRYLMIRQQDRVPHLLVYSLDFN